MPITVTGASRACRWVAVVTLALGIVAMHHLVGTHSHPGGPRGSSPSMTIPVTAVGNDDSDFGAAAVVPAWPGPHGGLMVHLPSDRGRAGTANGAELGMVANPCTPVRAAWRRTR
ncbi:MAG TPA: hypothetical protein VFA63_04655 [Pseudonocardiaceae bacterium]|nr:hypothetical protein [Pseudonocardiaceae bacterium]